VRWVHLKEHRESRSACRAGEFGEFADGSVAMAEMVPVPDMCCGSARLPESVAAAEAERPWRAERVTALARRSPPPSSESTSSARLPKTSTSCADDPTPRASEVTRMGSADTALGQTQRPDVRSHNKVVRMSASASHGSHRMPSAGHISSPAFEPSQLRECGGRVFNADARVDRFTARWP
jgi:hypothetical protein